MDTKQARIDWVTLFWLMAEDNEAQEQAANYTSLARQCERDANEAPGQHKLRVVSGKQGANRYAKLEIWGPAADLFAKFLNESDWLRVTRLDWRIPQPERTDVEMKNFTVGALRQGAVGRNMAALDSAPRKKNWKRDIGGHGVRIGSGKSGDYGVVYKRGRERPAYEYRIQNQKCRAMITHVNHAMHIGAFRNPTMYLNICQVLDGHAYSFLGNTTGFTDAALYIDDRIGEENGALEFKEALRANAAVAGGQLEFWNALARVAPEEENAYTMPGFDQRGQVVGTQYNSAAPIKHSCLRCLNSPCVCYDIFPDTDAG